MEGTDPTLVQHRRQFAGRAGRVRLPGAPPRSAGEEWTVHPPSRSGHRACPSLMARAGLPRGTRGIRLRLLPSGPDLVRVPTSRGTRPSTPPRRTDPDGQSLGTVVGPARADCGL